MRRTKDQKDLDQAHTNSAKKPTAESPTLHQAMKKAKRKIQSGTAEWHSYNEVFGE